MRQYPSRNRVCRLSAVWDMLMRRDAIRMEMENDQKLFFSSRDDISRTARRIEINGKAF